MKKLRVVRKSFVGLVKKLSKQEHKAKKATSRLTKLKRHFSLLRSKLNRLTRLMVSTYLFNFAYWVMDLKQFPIF